MLEIAGLDVAYGHQRGALSGVDLVVGEGELVALLGNNGAGKTTLLRAISGTLGLHRGSIRSGSITFEGTRIDGRSAAVIAGRGVIQVPEGRRLFPQMSVAENLRAGSLRSTRSQRSESLEYVYDLFPVLHEREAQRATLLSGGEQQMLAIGRALMSRPRLLMLDEPSLGLAPKIVSQVMTVLAGIHAAGTTVLLIEQNARQALAVADQVYVLSVGRLAFRGTAGDASRAGLVEELLLHGASAGREAVAADG